MIRKMTAPRRDVYDVTDNWMKYANHIARGFVNKYAVELWDATHHRLLFGFAGHIYRMQVYHEERLVVQVLTSETGLPYSG